MDSSSREAQEIALRNLLESEQRYRNQDANTSPTNPTSSELESFSKPISLPSDRVPEQERGTLDKSRLR